MYHIRRDGGWICGKSKESWAYKHHGHVSFKHAHSLDLEKCCGECKKRYYEILEKLKDPIIVRDRRKPAPKKKSNQVIIEPGIIPVTR